MIMEEGQSKNVLFVSCEIQRVKSHFFKRKRSFSFIMQIMQVMKLLSFYGKSTETLDSMEKVMT